MSRAMSTPMTDAAQPMPDRLKVRMSCLNLKWLTIFADREGVGLNAEQFTIRPSTCQNAHNPRHADWFDFSVPRQTALHGSPPVQAAGTNGICIPAPDFSIIKFIMILRFSCERQGAGKRLPHVLHTRWTRQIQTRPNQPGARCSVFILLLTSRSFTRVRLYYGQNHWAFCRHLCDTAHL